MGITVFGAVFVDIKGHPFNTYIPAGRNAGRVEEVHGGVSRNIAEDIANVELRPTFVSLVDESGAGLAVMQKLKKRKVNTDYIQALPEGMGTWLVIFDHSGDVVASISQRPDLSPIGDLLDERGDEIFSQAHSVVLEIDMDKELVMRILRLADKYRVPVYGAISNMSIALQRRHVFRSLDCFVCNDQEAGMFFSADYENAEPEALAADLEERIRDADIPRMVVTLGSKGAVWADKRGGHGVCPPVRVEVQDTAGAGDAFMAGVSIGLTYGKTLAESCEIGARLASAVICTDENVCPRFLPAEFDIELDAQDNPVPKGELLRTLGSAFEAGHKA